VKCPCFVEEYSGICVANKLPYIPSIIERGNYCDEKDFQACPIYINNKPETNNMIIPGTTRDF